MDAAQFDQQIADLAGTLGDATRRGIYISVRESPEPMTASRIAELFDIHSNVARHHLDRLVADGYLRVTRRRVDGRTGPGAGRPAKHYEPTSKPVSVQFPVRRHDLLAELLLRVVERVAPDRAAGLLRLGLHYFKTRQIEKANKALQKALGWDPTDPLARMAMGKVKAGGPSAVKDGTWLIRKVLQDSGDD